MRVKPQIILSCVSCFAFVRLKNLEDAALSAISQILNAGFATQEGQIDVVSCGNNDGPGMKIFEKLARNSNWSSTFRLNLCDDGIISLNMSTVLTFDSAESFKETENRIDWQTHRETRHKHLVYIVNGTTSDINSSVENGFVIDKVGFLVNENKKSIDLATSFMFTEGKCRENQIVVINRFSKDTMAWESDNFHPNKYRNFHGCELTYVGLARSLNRKPMSYQLLSVLSHLLRFKMRIVHASDYKGFLKMMDSRQDDFYDVITDIGNENFLNVLITDELTVYAIPFGNPLTSFEKLLSPFDSTTWILILTTMTTTFIGIQVSSFASLKVRVLFFEKKIGSPTMNFLSVFLCGCQAKAPKSSNARFIFLNFMIWSLIIRTCFQSLMYRNLQLDLRHPPMKTFQDIHDNQLKEWIWDPSQEDVNSSQNIPLKYVNTSLRHIFDVIAEPENKLVLLTTFEIVAYFRKKILREGKMSLTYLDEQLYPQPVVFSMKIFSPFFEEFKNKIQKLLETGYERKAFEHESINVKDRNEGINDDVPALILNMEDLGVGFLICLVPLTLAAVAFICELALPIIKALVISARDRLTILYLIRNVANRTEQNR